MIVYSSYDNVKILQLCNNFSVEDAKRDWCSDVLMKLNMHLSVVAIKHVEPVNKKTKVIRKKMMKNTIKHIFKKNTVAAYEERCVLCILIRDKVVEC